MGKQIRNFMDFVRSQGVVGLAVGLAIGAQVTLVTDSLVKNFINPLVGFILGNTDLTNLKWEVVAKSPDSSRALTFEYGRILDAVIRLLAVAAVIYFVVHGLKLDKVDKKKAEK
jgi:large conductance mechanosensitive channel protein